MLQKGHNAVPPDLIPMIICIEFVLTPNSRAGRRMEIIMKLTDTDAILIDFGGVLGYSVTGHWFLPPNFYTVADRNTFESINAAKIRHAFKTAGDYLDSIALIRTKEEEYELFKKYYKILADELPELKLDNEDIDTIAGDLVYNAEKYKFYEDARKTIPILHEKYKLAVVSDAWPSLKDVLANAGFDRYFSSIVISSILGTLKPDEKMYLTALKELKAASEKSVFIDDNPGNCLGAAKLGIKAFLICRTKRYYILQKILSIGKGYHVINSLEKLL